MKVQRGKKGFPDLFFYEPNLARHDVLIDSDRVVKAMSR